MQLVAFKMYRIGLDTLSFVGLIYYFLVERVYIIRRSSKSRIKDPLYLFNSIGMLIPYCIVIALNFVFPRSIPENMGFPNRDHLFMSTNGMNGGNPDDYRYARDAIDLPTVTTTVTAGVGVGVVETIDGEEEGKNRGLGNGNAEMGIRKPKMAIVVERDHVREVVETGIRIVNDRDHDRLILTLPRSISGGGGSIGIEIREREKEKGAGKIGEEDDMDISF
ncbi:hypothetical protein BPOR_0670g00030 [Botrytis porri]|uniref:Uncharacterized protein n=1 Tax=Botrytis porri TaxID=87229 RepID=A0A4Z1KD61_9HELO|nr:hypothetical protein BPOR_0670g00030 [Botrytis porri]